MPAPTTAAPIREMRINQVIYAGESGAKTIQAAVNYAAADGGSFMIVIPPGYPGGESIASIAGGSALIYLSDQRGATAQAYTWNGTNYTPAAFVQLGQIVILASDQVADDQIPYRQLSIGVNGTFGINSESEFIFQTRQVANDPLAALLELIHVVQGNATGPLLTTDGRGKLLAAAALICAGTSPVPLGTITLTFNAGGTGGNGSGNLTVAANPATGRPGFNLELMSEDGTVFTYIRCDEDATHLPRIQMPCQLIITGPATASGQVTAGQGMVRTMEVENDNFPDADTLNVAGTYYLTNGLSNGPSGIPARNAFLEVMASSDNYVVQRLTLPGAAPAGAFYVRSYQPTGVWSSWYVFQGTVVA